MLIGDLIRRRARNSPQAVYWEQPDARHTYADVNAAANRVAHALWTQDVAPGELVAIFSSNCVEYLHVHFGAAKAGAVLCHLNCHYTAGEVARLLAFSGATLLIYGAAEAGVVQAARSALPRVRAYVQIGGTPPDWAMPFAAWCAGQPSTEPDPGPVLRRHGARPWHVGDPFQVLYSSGTTGTPKAALISHRAKVGTGLTHALYMGLLPGDRVISALPLYHQFAQFLVTVSLPLMAATLVAEPHFDAGATWHALRHRGITHLPAVPTMLYRLLDDPAAGAGPAPNIKYVLYGAAPIHAGRIPALRACFPRARLYQGFGLTETGNVFALHDEDHQLRPDAVGRPDLFTDVRITDDAGRELPDGEVGEIVARTPYLMHGYLNDPRGTEEFFAFGREWGRTGDLGYRDRDGYFMLAGRRKELIVSGGVNIYPMEVEQVLMNHPAVAEAAVFGVPDADWGEAVVAAVVCAPGARPSPEDIVAHCRASLAGFKCPRRIEFTDAFPRTPNGKIRKVELQQRYSRARADDPSDQAARA